jgi:hypothetical protein
MRSRHRGILYSQRGGPLEQDLYCYAYICTAHTCISYVPIHLDVAKCQRARTVLLTRYPASMSEVHCPEYIT